MIKNVLSDYITFANTQYIIWEKLGLYSKVSYEIIITELWNNLAAISDYWQNVDRPLPPKNEAFFGAKD